MSYKSLVHNIRFWVLSFSIVLMAGVYTYLRLSIPSGDAQVAKITQTFALIAVSYLYITLLISPLYEALPSLPFKGQVTLARRALGVSVFLFALVHACYAFFGELGGFPGLPFLDQNYLLAITLSTIALIILSLLAVTSTDWAVRRLSGGRWKILHRFVYLAAFLIVIHATLLGTDFANPVTSPIARFSYIALSALLLLEAARIDRYVFRRQPDVPRAGIAVLAIVGLIFSTVSIFLSQNGTGLGIHAEHIQIAQQAQQGQVTTYATNPNIPGLQGDRTKRFSVSFLHADTIEPNQSTHLSFLVNDASNGSPVTLYTKVYDKFAHLVIVDDSLQYFAHLHPDGEGPGFGLDTSFPHPGTYHLYIDFQPYGAIEQQFAFSVTVAGTEPNFTPISVDTVTTKTFGNYDITLKSPVLKAADLSVGNQTLTFTLTNHTTGKPVTNLQPYLAAFGHLVLVNEQTYDYVHVHPTNITAPAPTDTSGPDVVFQPLGLYGPIKPGIYEAFAQFNPGGQLLTATFTIKIE